MSRKINSNVIKLSKTQSNESSYHWERGPELYIAETLQWNTCNCLNRSCLLWPLGELNLLQFPSSQFSRCWINTLEEMKDKCWNYSESFFTDAETFQNNWNDCFESHKKASNVLCWFIDKRQCHLWRKLSFDAFLQQS